ncbi:hypothetical protein LELG_04775 [Lodderomyces elongisporus NRRL YB-4239]|uniref:Rho-GAP domain-containing protein n=1 Tax=Lodderomyces elongisporus (strain ATCC 11503 / CBS 2605 / JCM 1781 / NBRC 1676 / NRRL YB-4239) TaxID=379508 RepID=A5E586_LODEL|nr:hypothetical protein LELG_04775 [Lodderomyces elongisporus NRRL YB-4239]
MSALFANSYWSADYISGLDSLKAQSATSINQLHEFRRLVFNYLKFHFSNSEYLDQSVKNLYSSESPFYSKGNEKNEQLTFTSCYKSFVGAMEQESVTYQMLASNIDKQVLEDLTAYIKYHEPKINREIDRLDELYEKYLSIMKQIMKYKQKYQDQIRLKEFAESSKTPTKTGLGLQGFGNGDTLATKEDTDYSDDELYADDDSDILEQQQQEQQQQQRGQHKDKPAFDFPMKIGSAQIENTEELQKLISHLIEKTPTSKRGVPLPGFKNEMFVSDSLCDVLTRLRIKGMGPSRLNIEKFGQSLADWKLITPTNIFLRKFKSEGVWFEWSDLAYSTATLTSTDCEMSKENIKSEENFPRSTTAAGTHRRMLLSQMAHSSLSFSSPTSSSSSSSKFVKDMSETTAKFNAMFSSMKNSMLKTNHEELIVDSIQSYNENLLKFYETEYFLQKGLLEFAAYLEKFEKKKNQIMYDGSVKLLQIAAKSYARQTANLERLTKTTTLMNIVENYEHDFLLTFEKFKTGLYMPITLSQQDNFKLLNQFLPQNLKFSFDLFSDIPLQPTVLQTQAEPILLSTASIPILLYKIIMVLENKPINSNSDDNKRKEEGDALVRTDLQELWLRPIDFQLQWRIKEQLTQLIANTLSVNPEDQNDVDVDLNAVNLIIEELLKRSTAELVAFLKSWLLEIKDSIIPFIVYESIIKDYATSEDSNEAKNVKHRTALKKLLSLIPRSNLASLIYILEHICKIFQLKALEGYGKFDDLPTSLSAESKEQEQIEHVSDKLNLMEMVAAVPFIHLIMRPSSSKVSAGFKPPLAIYKKLLTDLLDLDVRSDLFKVLVENEKKFREKKANEKIGGLSVKKIHVQDSVTSAPKIDLNGSTLYDDDEQHYDDNNDNSEEYKNGNGNLNGNSNNKNNKKNSDIDVPVTPQRKDQSTLSNPEIKTPRPLSGGSFSLRPFKTRSTPAPSPNASPTRHLRQVDEEITRAQSPNSSLLVPNLDIQFEGK